MQSVIVRSLLSDYFLNHLLLTYFLILVLCVPVYRSCSCFLVQLLSSLFPVSLPLSSKSYLCILSMFIGQCLVCSSLSQYVLYPVYCLCLILLLCSLLYWLSGFGLPFCVLTTHSLAFCLGTVLYLISWLMTPVCSLTPISACHIKYLIFFTLCIWVPHLLSLPITIYNTELFAWLPTTQETWGLN